MRATDDSLLGFEVKSIEKNIGVTLPKPLGLGPGRGHYVLIFSLNRYTDKNVS